MSLKYKNWSESTEGKKWLKDNPGKKGDFKTYNNEPSLTRQEFLEESKINNIVDKYTRTGRLPYDSDRLGMYVDVSEVGDFQSALSFVNRASESFERLDPNVRKRFQNSPQALIEFLKDPSNKEEGIKLGLINPAKPEPASKATPLEETPSGKKDESES